MRILGVDPGLANLGLGAIETAGVDARLLASELVSTSARASDGARLARIHDAVRAVLHEHAIEALAVEGQFFHRQRDAAMKVGQALGVVYLAAHQADVPVHAYGPMQVKQSLVGTGRADKAQVTYMVRALLSLGAQPLSHHVSDALALALTHWSAHRIGSLGGRGG